jgi:hypothetical protein
LVIHAAELATKRLDLISALLDLSLVAVVGKRLA